VGGTFHALSLAYTSGVVGDQAIAQGPPKTRVDFEFAFSPQVAFDMTIVGGFIRFAPWLGLDIATPAHQFTDQSGMVTVGETGRLTAEGGLRAEFVLP
jgi:hypothetical protein